MEGFFTLLAIFVVWNLITNFFRNQKNKKLVKKMEEEIKQNPFQCIVNNDTIDIDEETRWDVLHIQMKGIINGPHDDFDLRFIAKITDITDDEEHPILCMLDEFKSLDSDVFWYEGNVEKFPYESTILKNWVTVVKVPKIFLTCARSGNRKIKVEVFAIKGNTDTILEQASSEFTFYSENTGYQEKSENRDYFEEMTVKTAMLVSASDGSMDASEADIIKEWVRKRVNAYTDEYQEDEKKRLNSYIREAYEEINNNSIDIYEVLEGIENIASEGEKFDLFELCLDVAKADGEADKEELQIINEIAKYIGLDEKQFRSMVEKTLPITMHTSEVNDEDLLGIKSDMTKEEIKKHLRNEYRKWNQRIGSSDSELREQAETMIHLIAEARKKYK